MSFKVDFLFEKNFLSFNNEDNMEVLIIIPQLISSYVMGKKCPKIRGKFS